MLGGRVGVSGTPCEQRGCLDPSPYPLPWAWKGGGGGGVRASKMAQEGSKRASKSQDGLQDVPRYFKMAQDSLRHTSMRPQGCPKTDPSAFRAFNGTLQDAKILQKPKKLNVLGIFAFSPFRFRWAWASSRWPQYGPRELQEGPKRAPRRY